MWTCGAVRPSFCPSDPTQDSLTGVDAVLLENCPADVGCCRTVVSGTTLHSFCSMMSLDRSTKAMLLSGDAVLMVVTGCAMQGRLLLFSGDAVLLGFTGCAGLVLVVVSLGGCPAGRNAGCWTMTTFTSA